MWYKTKASEILRIDYPVLQGPFGGGLSSPKLVSTVSNAGGLGGYGAYQLQPEEIIEIDKQIKSLTQKPYALNLWVSDVDEEINRFGDQDFEILKSTFKPYFDELNISLPEKLVMIQSKFDKQVETILKIKPPVLSFIFGVPSKEILKECKKEGIITIGTATTLDEALVLEEANVDMIVASGFEAGGHRSSFLRKAEDSLTGNFALIPQIADQVKKPVIAAGGIADGRGIVAALILGASAVQIGTAFLACEESNATDLHRKIIFSEQAKYSVLSRAFTGRLSRGIQSKIAMETKGYENQFAPFPIQSIFMSSLRKAAIEQNKSEMFTFWAGQNAPLVKYKNAEQLMNSLISQVNTIYKKE